MLERNRKSSGDINYDEVFHSRTDKAPLRWELHAKVAQTRSTYVSWDKSKLSDIGHRQTVYKGQNHLQSRKVVLLVCDKGKVGSCQGNSCLI